RPAAPGQNFSEPKPVTEITGSWGVYFNPRWKGPGKVTFDRLADWTQRSEPGVKHYSGLARYTTTFGLPATATVKGSRWYLDLGQVRNLARIR
ncbi:hypothetical protein P6O77_15615, partial [Clostridium perfringens]|nr:hypothetical protein [Clostridium perfringens]